MDASTAEAVCRAAQTVASTQAKLAEIAKLGIRTLTRLDGDYPPTLRQAQNPPPVIYQAGEWRPGDDLTVAIIGSRDCSSISARRAGEYASWLTRRGLVVVSGYAEGVDMAAHLGTIDAGGRTIIIPSCGAKRFDFTPLKPVDVNSFTDLSKSALWLSEQPPETDWSTRGARARNRLVAAMAKVVLVIKAQVNSSTLDTVEKARGLGRPIFCQSFGTVTQKNMGNDLLKREGAGVIATAADLEALVQAAAGAKPSGSTSVRPEDPRR